MNVVFLDFDGVIATYHHQSDEEVEEKIKIVCDLAKKYNFKIVIESGKKCLIDENTLETNNKWVKFILDTFRKYDAEVIGRTPNIGKGILDMWKEYEIIAYLKKHPEIEHFCVIDDDDQKISDLNKLRDYLIKTEFINDENWEEEGILPKHEKEIYKILKKDKPKSF